MHTKDLINCDDDFLLTELRSDCSLAFDALYNKYWQLVYANAHKRLGDEDLAKDITQEIFLKLWNLRHQSSIKNLPAYLYTAVKNAVYNYFEKEKKYVAVTDLIMDREVSNEGADSRLLVNELLRTYEVLLKKLSGSQQIIFKMRFDEDESTQAISQKLGISRKTVQNQLGKSLLQLREAMMFLF